MQYNGYLVLDLCSDGKHNSYAFPTIEEANQRFRECVSFYNEELTDKELEDAVIDRSWADYSGNAVYLEPLNTTVTTLF